MAPPSKINREEAYRLNKEEGWTYQQIGKHFGATLQGARQAILKYEEEVLGQEPESGRKHRSAWPWVLAPEHSAGEVQYRRMLALRKQREGYALSPQDAKLAQSLLAFISKGDLVITYHRKCGFVFTPRRASDGDEVFVVRPDWWWEQKGYAA